MEGQASVRGKWSAHADKSHDLCVAITMWMDTEGKCGKTEVKPIRVQIRRVGKQMETEYILGGICPGYLSHVFHIFSFPLVHWKPL